MGNDGKTKVELVTYLVEAKHMVVLIGLLKGVNVNISGVCNTTNFEVIEIVDGSKTYSVFLGLECDFDNQTIINMKKRQMIFEVADLRVTVPLNPTEGRRYVEPTRGK
jgi:hypothetical protein